jgi:hypothetical protein
MEFIAALVAAAAWPLVGLFAIVLLRKPISDLLNTEGLKRLKAGGFEIELFDQGIKDAKASLESEKTIVEPPAVVPTGQSDVLDVAGYREEMASLAAINPSAAVLASFTRLERLLRQGVDVVQGDFPRARPIIPRQLGELALRQGLWSSSELAAFHDLISLRNVAAHGEVVNLDESRALEFTELALQLMIALERGASE